MRTKNINLMVKSLIDLYKQYCSQCCITNTSTGNTNMHVSLSVIFVNHSYLMKTWLFQLFKSLISAFFDWLHGMIILDKIFIIINITFI